MKMEYTKPELELIRFETVDAVTVSNFNYIPGEDELPLVPAP